MFVIEDESHSDMIGEYGILEDALVELRKRAKLPWDGELNRAPCQGWEKCGRKYHIIEYDKSTMPFIEKQRQEVLRISAKEVYWNPQFVA